MNAAPWVLAAALLSGIDDDSEKARAALETAARRSRPSGYLGSTLLVDHGPSAIRVDVALMGDGYTLDHQDTFDALAEDVTPLFERQKTFREYFPCFDFRRFNLASEDDGVDGFGREEDTALDARTLGTIAGHVGIDQSPGHDGLAIVFVRVGALGTGGGGIATIGGRSARTTIHEWGHAFSRLGDEYAQKTHDRGGVGEAVNVSASEDPERVPWAHGLAAPGSRRPARGDLVGPARGAGAPGIPAAATGATPAARTTAARAARSP